MAAKQIKHDQQETFLPGTIPDPSNEKGPPPPYSSLRQGNHEPVPGYSQQVTQQTYGHPQQPAYEQTIQPMNGQQRRSYGHSQTYGQQQQQPVYGYQQPGMVIQPISQPIILTPAVNPNTNTVVVMTGTGAQSQHTNTVVATAPTQPTNTTVVVTGSNPAPQQVTPYKPYKETLWNNHRLNIILSIVFPPWIIVWIILCMLDM